MPETFPVIDPATRERIDVLHYRITEVADMLHMGTTTAYRLLKEEDWPHLQIANRVWVSEADLAAIIDGMRRGRPSAAVPQAEHPAPLGLAVPADPEPADGTPDSDPGGVR